MRWAVQDSNLRPPACKGRVSGGPDLPGTAIPAWFRAAVPRRMASDATSGQENLSRNLTQGRSMPTNGSTSSPRFGSSLGALPRQLLGCGRDDLVAAGFDDFLGVGPGSLRDRDECLKVFGSNLAEVEDGVLVHLDVDGEFG